MKNFLKKILKKLNLFWKVRKIYQFFFYKGYIYQKFQRLFTRIDIRTKIAFLERKVAKFIFFRSKKYFNSNIVQNNNYCTQLDEQGTTSPFTLESVEKNNKGVVAYIQVKDLSEKRDNKNVGNMAI